MSSNRLASLFIGSSLGVLVIAVYLITTGDYLAGAIVALPLFLVYGVVVQRELRAIVTGVLLFQSVMVFYVVLQYRELQSHEKSTTPRVLSTKTTGVPEAAGLVTVADVPYIPAASLQVLRSTFGMADTERLIESSFSDLLYRSPDLVRSKLPRIFRELPKEGFLPDFKNPCWYAKKPSEEEQPPKLTCLPYIYMLGLPKCGTTDLFLRLAAHPQVVAPKKKEIRWFTRGEFTSSYLQEETEAANMDTMDQKFYTKRLGSGSSIFSFTKEFDAVAERIAANPTSHITLDGGPHTLWWPTQSPDGTFLEDIPAAQILREIQPHAKFVVTLSDPVKRLYSDYHFLDENLQVHDMNVRKNMYHANKSPQDFHGRVVKQVSRFKKCVSAKVTPYLREDLDLHDLSDMVQRLTTEKAGVNVKDYSESHKMLLQHWFRASQACAHDRHLFGIAGWGRLAIGLYVLFLEKWFEHFKPAQFLVVRLEDFANDPQAYMQRVFRFLQLTSPTEDEWTKILVEKLANEHKTDREPMLPETVSLLEAFYQPYNNLLATMLHSPGFVWEAEDEVAQDPPENAEALESTDAPKSVSKSSVRALALENGQWIGPIPRTKQAKHTITNAHGPRAVHREPEEHSFGKNQEAHSAASLSLRGPGDVKTPVKPLILKPRSFSIKGLPPAPHNFNAWIAQGDFINHTRVYLPQDRTDAAMHLCTAAFALDIAALKYLLYDVGLPADLVDTQDSDRNAFHSLALVASMTEAHPQSHLFVLLKNKTSWLSEYVDPPIRLPVEPHSQSVYVRDIIDGLGTAVVNAAKWLHAAGISASEIDATGSSPLHMAASAGLLGLVKFLIALKVPIDVANADLRTPLHYALYHGHAETAGVLVAAGADLKAKDKFGTTPFAIASAPGPVSAEDALAFLNIKQRGPKKIKRILHPEWNATLDIGWAPGTGGWGTNRLKGFEDHMYCDIDQYNADEVTPEFLFKNYVAKMTPVLVRGLFSDWQAIERYAHDKLIAERGTSKVTVSDIPYAEKFGGNDHAEMTLKAYVEEVKNHRMLGGAHPWYVFRGHPIPKYADGRDTFVPYATCPTPETIQYSFEQLAPADRRGKKGIESRSVFINAQWAIGGEGTGAPVHFHNLAWNALIYGAKEWLLYPPHSAIMSNRQILDFFETDLLSLQKRGIKPLRCVQTAGDAIIVPESWGHGVLNLQESVAIATESRFNEFRIRPWGKILSRVPHNNAKK